MNNAAIMFVAKVYRREHCVAAERRIVGFSHFPNITHAHALASEVKRDSTAELLEQSWRRLHFVSEISRLPFDRFRIDALKVGFLRGSVDLSHLVEVPR